MIHRALELDSKMQAAVEELKTLVRHYHPEAQFRVSRDLKDQKQFI